MGAAEPPKPKEEGSSPRQTRNGVESTDQRDLPPVDNDDPNAMPLENENIRTILRDEVEKEKVPAKSPEIEKGGYAEDVVEDEQKRGTTISPVLFSEAFFQPVKAEADPVAGDFSVTTEDAIHRLLKAPMLSDIQAWSCWGHLFAPTLGPVIKWLESEVHTNELLCLVTTNGKVIRIDPTATVDRLLKASFDHSPVRAATQLLSLLALNWKEMHIIVDRLKSHTSGPIEQFCRCFTDPGGKYWRLMHKDSTRLKPLMVEHPGNVAQETAISNIKKSSNEVVSAVSKFILQILGYLPPEFRIVATNLLLPGLANVTKDAPSALLRECCNTEQLIMLREVGLSLHISEWIEDVPAFLPDSGSLHGQDKAFSDHDQSNLSDGEFDHDFKQHSPELDEDQDKNPLVRQESFVTEPGQLYPYAQFGLLAPGNTLYITPDSDSHAINDMADHESAGTFQIAEAREVGLEGEQSAFDHLKEWFGESNVEWVNSKVESRSPYDFIIWEDKSKKVVKMYVEVKATKYPEKNSFFISDAQWKFARKMGKKFGIMHIWLADGAVSFFDDPVEKCRKGKLRHCLWMPR